MNNNVINYLRAMDNKTICPGNECNSMVANLLIRLHPEVQSDLQLVIKQLRDCKTFLDIRKVIKQDNRTARKYLEQYGYKQVNTNQIKKVIFLLNQENTLTIVYI